MTIQQALEVGMIHQQIAQFDRLLQTIDKAQELGATNARVEFTALWFDTADVQAKANTAWHRTPTAPAGFYHPITDWERAAFREGIQLIRNSYVLRLRELGVEA